MMRLFFTFLAISKVAAVPFASEESTPSKHEPVYKNEDILEDDMLLGPQQVRNMRSGLRNDTYRWPNATLVYKVADDHFTEQETNLIRSSLEFFNENTCVAVREATEADGLDYVSVENGAGKGCTSRVGCLTWDERYKPQRIFLSPGDICFKKKGILHEFLHAFGFIHQQGASDRDDYVQILWENIKNGMEGNFRLHTESDVTDFGCGYDYDSIMHYDNYAFTKNGKPTIIARSDPARRLGTSEVPTEVDLKKLSCMYVRYSEKCSCEC